MPTTYNNAQVLQAIVTADQTLQSNTTLANITDLILPVVANGVYLLDAEIYFNLGTNTMGQKFAVAGPASPTLVFLGTECVIYPAVAQISGGSATAFATAMAATTTNATGDCVARITGTIYNGANAGNIQAQFAQNVSIATNLTIKKGSRMKLTVLS